MTSPSWDRVKEVCLAALELHAGERAAYLDRACGGDRALRSEVESLLGHYDPDFLEEPVVTLSGLEPEAEAAPGARPLPGRIGSYRIVRLLGRGGMGEVLLAIQEGEGFERPVALKLVRAGMATDDVLGRFRQERRILASLDHPNLARLIDGGATEDGQPYFVMEYVEGVSITEYCDRRALDVPARLELFMAVCDAVHHAHQSLVVHRDIKPSNVLVTSDGLPKLLDFGIGKVLDPTEDGAPDRTAMTRRVLTPEYAAPEQVQGGVITTATDVHGLGVLLYELLTGRHPFSSGATTPEALDRALQEMAPTTPSAAVTQEVEDDGSPRSPSEVARLRGSSPQRLRRRLRGDLDNIVLTALRKEPERRYPSAEAMKADIERHLRGLPVRARPDSLGYRVGKFVARNPWGVAAALLAAVAIGVSIVLPWRQNVRLTQERDKAVAIQTFLLEAFGTTRGDESIGARDLLDLQAGRVESQYAGQPALLGQMLLVLAEAYDRLGLYNDALPLAERSVGVLRDLHGGDHPEVGTALNTWGWALHQTGSDEEAVPALEEAVAMRRRLGRGARRDLARSLNDLGVVHATLGDNARAVEMHREALSIRRTVLGDRNLATGVSASNLAAALYGMGDLVGAAREGGLALELLRSSVGPDHQRTTIVQSNLAVFMQAAGDLEGAEEVYRDLLERQSRLQGPDHPITNQVRSNLANVLVATERWEEAEPIARDVIGYAEAQGDAGLDRWLLATAYLARSLTALDRGDETVALLDRAIPVAEARRTGRPIVADLYQERRDARQALRQWAEAASDQRRLIAARRPRLAPDGEALASYRIRLAQLLLNAGSYAAADEVLSQVRAVAEGPGISEGGLAALERLEGVLAERR